MTTARITDQNGYIEIKDNPISRVGIYQYQGEMIGGEAGHIYNVLRSAEELSRPETLDSLRLMPFIDGHTMLGEGEKDVANYPVSGTTGEDIYFNPEDGTLYANLKIWSQQILEKIDGEGIKELSAGYKADHAIFEKEIKADYKFANGEFNGQPFDAVQVNIRFNHVALVENGRMGSTVKVLDQADNTGAPKMNEDHVGMIKSLIEQNARTNEMLMKLLSQESAEPHESEDIITLEGNKEPVKDEDDKDDTMDEFPPEEDDKEKVKDKCDTMDEEESEKPEEKKDAKVMDSAMIASVAKRAAEQATLKTIRSMGAKADLANKIITAGVGVFDHAEMSIDAVAAYGVKNLGLKCPKGLEQVALNFYFSGLKQGSKSSANVMDSTDFQHKQTSSIDLKEFA